VVPVFAAVAKLLAPRIEQAVALREQEINDGGRSR
jgi:DNA (cytosine-5)-methyltransferase 1